MVIDSPITPLDLEREGTDAAGTFTDAVMVSVPMVAVPFFVTQEIVRVPLVALVTSDMRDRGISHSTDVATPVAIVPDLLPMEYVRLWVYLFDALGVAIVIALPICTVPFDMEGTVAEGATISIDTVLVPTSAVPLYVVQEIVPVPLVALGIT